MTLRQFRNSFFAHLGIEQAVATLPNDSMTVNKTIVATQTEDSSAVTEESSISGKTVVTAICEINGCFGNINRDGKFEYVTLNQIISPVYPSEDLFPSESLFPTEPNSESMTGNYVTFDYEDFNSKAITQLEIRSSDDSSGVTAGKPGNNYVISGNFLVSDKSSDELTVIANNILPVIAQAAYTPIKSSTCIGNPCLEVGDAIRFNTSKEVVETYILQRTLTGVQSKRDSITSQGTETHTKKVNSIRDIISSVQSRTNRLERTADHTLSEIKSLGESTEKGFSDMSSTIEQTANGLKKDYEQKITEYDAKAQGYASAAESNANAATDGKLKNYTQTTEMKNLIEETADGTKQEISKTLTSYATKTDAQGYASTAESNANSSTDGKLKKYSTTTEMQTEIQKSAEGVEQTVSKTYSTKTEAQGYASTAESNANAATDEKLEDYATTVEMDTKFAQTAHSIEMTATGGDQTVGITIQIVDANGNVIDTAESNANITVTGFVSFWDLLNAGSTTINGANITTGTISGVTFISNNGAEQVEIEDGNVSFYYNWNKLGRLRTGSFVNADSQLGIMLESISPYALGVGSGGEYYFLINPSSKQVKFYSGVLFSGTCGFNGYSSFAGTANFFSSVNFAERPKYDGSGLVTYDDLNGRSTYISASKTPTEIGSSTHRVTSIDLNGGYDSVSISYNYLVTGSDRRLKKGIRSIFNRIEKAYLLFNPVSYEFKDELSHFEKGRHYGLIAQEVYESLRNSGVECDDLNLVYQRDVDEESNENLVVNDSKVWTINYDELHALHIHMIQKQQSDIEKLKQENFVLSGEVDILKQRLNQMEEMLNVINSKIN